MGEIHGRRYHSKTGGLSVAVTLKQTEDLPTSYPTVTGLSTEADALDKDALWQRLEAYCAYRWTPRTVVWVAEGCGDWKAPLAPAEVSLCERWNGQEYETVTPDASPYGGYVFHHHGPHRITATVGDGVTCPAAVLEAFRRFAEYSAEINAEDSAAAYRAVSEGSLSETVRRNVGWTARALINSGAADLLRPYRRA
jgi:hypothetical protein